MKIINVQKMNVYNTYKAQPILTITIYPKIGKMNILGWYDDKFPDLVNDGKDTNTIK